VYTVKIKTLTPLWTGDANRKGETLRETGIIGSLRWWYEALIRGLGGTACDPTDTKCDDKSRCDACELFGCTGWSRKFKLEVNLDSGEKNLIPLNIEIGTRQKHQTKREKQYLKRVVSNVVTNDSVIYTFVPLKEIEQGEWVLLRNTLQIIEDYGALGARISQGNGVIKITDCNLPSGNSAITLSKNGKTAKEPNLKDFFFWKFRIGFTKEVKQLINKRIFWTHDPQHKGFEDNWKHWEKLWNRDPLFKDGFLPIAFHIRDMLRSLVEDTQERHSLFGERGSGLRIFVSHGYKKGENIIEFRVFGYHKSGQEKKLWNAINKNNLSEKFFSKDDDYVEKVECVCKKTGEEIIGDLKGEGRYL